MPTNIVFIGTIFTLLIAWNAALSYVLYRYARSFRAVTQGVSKKDLREIFDDISKNIKTMNKDISQLENHTQTLETAAQEHLQKYGLLRFNPFGDTGGDQSFCICLLDQKDNGIVITSLHSRDQTRIYAKPITQGKATGFNLSAEEEQTVQLAQKGNHRK